MPIPRKIALFRDQTLCYPTDAAGQVWHVYGAWGPLCEIVFAEAGEPEPDHPELVFQDAPDYIGGIGRGELGYDLWEDRRTVESWDLVPPEFEGMAFLARRFGLKMENPQHRAVAALLFDLVDHQVLQGIPESEGSALVQRWLAKLSEALEG